MRREDLTDYETATSLFILAKMHRRVAHSYRVFANSLGRELADGLARGRVTSLGIHRTKRRILDTRENAKREEDKAAFYKRAGQLALIGADALAHEAREMAQYEAPMPEDIRAVFEAVGNGPVKSVRLIPVNTDREQVASLNRRDDPASLPPGLAITRDCLDCGD